MPYQFQQAPCIPIFCILKVLFSFFFLTFTSQNLNSTDQLNKTGETHSIKSLGTENLGIFSRTFLSQNLSIEKVLVLLDLLFVFLCNEIRQWSCSLCKQLVYFCRNLKDYKINFSLFLWLRIKAIISHGSSK